MLEHAEKTSMDSFTHADAAASPPLSPAAEEKKAASLKKENPAALLVPEEPAPAKKKVSMMAPGKTLEALKDDEVNDVIAMYSPA